MNAKTAYSTLAQLILFVFVSSGCAQISSRQFVIDESKPYVYLKFDHFGDREPANNGESSKGLWLRLVNNCSLPIKISVFHVGMHNQGFALNFDVVPRMGRIDSEVEEHQKMPRGYSVDSGTLTVIPPNGDLLFSVPAESVTNRWYIEVRFNFHIPSPKGSYHPYSVADFTWNDIPQRLVPDIHPPQVGQRQ